MSMTKCLTTLLAAAALMTALPSIAQEHNHSAPQAVTETTWVNGIVRKVDAAAGKVTLSHGPLTNLKMSAMTMVFRVADPTWLEQLKAGDKIRFTADLVDGALTVVQLETAAP
ncbi:MAG TPA: copper-binding protein [Rhodocyclaceae bacterium]|nr:copper-binding protein [Rhodocyclaceae bacterium]